jgi:dipeptidase E
MIFCYDCTYMKRLFLASSGLAYMKTFVGGEPSRFNLLFVPTAGNLDKDVWWIDKDRAVLRDMGFRVTELDIEGTSHDELRRRLAQTDIVYIAGGNTFHLLKCVRDSGFDTLLTEFVNGGGLYAGASAGALIAGLDIEPVASMDEPVPGLKSTAGLGFVDIVPIPHYDMHDRTDAIDAIKRQYADRYEIVLLTDDQAIVVEGNEWRKVVSKRNKLELKWAAKAQH